MNAVPKPQRPEVQPLEVQETRDFRSYHAFLRAARNYIEGPLLAQTFDRYEREVAAAGAPQPADWRDAEAVLDRTTEYQLYNWYYRNLQRFKYHRPDVGIFATLEAQRARLEARLDETARTTPPAQLRLNPVARASRVFPLRAVPPAHRRRRARRARRRRLRDRPAHHRRRALRPERHLPDPVRRAARRALRESARLGHRARRRAAHLAATAPGIRVPRRRPLGALPEAREPARARTAAPRCTCRSRISSTSTIPMPAST